MFGPGPKARLRLEWLSPDDFQIDGLHFHCNFTDFSLRTTKDRVVLLKPRSFIDSYLELIQRLRPRNILEFGVWQGGSALFLASAGRVDRLVGVELNPSLPVLEGILAAHPIGQKITLHFGTSQDDSAAVRSIMDREFGPRPLDIIVDDASHLYRQTKVSFETAFGYLRPGGVYVIEDWGWAHWPDWQRADHHWIAEDALSNLIFELTMIIGRQTEIISKIEIVNGAMIVITRGSALKHGEPLDIASHILSRGRSLGRI